MDMNGNCSAGMLAGVARDQPQTRKRMDYKTMGEGI